MREVEADRKSSLHFEMISVGDVQLLEVAAFRNEFDS
jgi:hypothetical protein